jgi:hypothetical protein
LPARGADLSRGTDEQLVVARDHRRFVDRLPFERNGRLSRERYAARIRICSRRADESNIWSCQCGQQPN